MTNPLLKDLIDLESIPTLGDDGDVDHIYPGPRDTRPQPGEVALCGHVKRGPVRYPSDLAAELSGTPLCALCAEKAVQA